MISENTVSMTPYHHFSNCKSGIKVAFIVAFVRTHPNLGVPVSNSQDFSSCRGRLPVNIRNLARASIIEGGSRSRGNGLVWTRFRCDRVITNNVVAAFGGYESDNFSLGKFY